MTTRLGTNVVTVVTAILLALGATVVLHTDLWAGRTALPVPEAAQADIQQDPDRLWLVVRWECLTRQPRLDWLEITYAYLYAGLNNRTPVEWIGAGSQTAQ